ncbi:MAG: hypothetical protein LUJ25_02455 [Firmicutes bacterium]|nr:hypothetical protein [Bacillota bacterium]
MKKYIEEKWSAFIDPVRKFCTIDDKTVKELTTTVGRFYDYDKNKIIAWDKAAPRGGGYPA